MKSLIQAASQALGALEAAGYGRSYAACDLRQALAEQALNEQAQPRPEPACNNHPKAPHGFVRNASHNNNRYTCECEGWDPYEAGYEAGLQAGLKHNYD